MTCLGKGARWAAVIALLGSVAVGCAHGPSLTERRGQPFPDLLLQDVLVDDPGTALGGASPRRLPLSDLPGEVLVLEFFNSRCPTCQRQAPELEKAFRAFSSGALAGRVRVVAIGAGDLARDLEAFRREQDLSYPLVADPWYDLYGRLGALPRSPVTLLLRKEGGQWLQADVIHGHVEATALVERAQGVLAGQGAGRAPEPAAAGFDPPLGWDETRRAAEMLAFLSGIDPAVRGVEPVALAGGVVVYRGLGAAGEPRGLYGRIASRVPVCDVCHAVHFLLAFDGAGTVRGFEPIHVTKAGNLPISAEEASRLRSRLVGRSLAGTTFDPALDSVTGATLSASVVFDEARRSAALVFPLRGR